MRGLILERLPGIAIVLLLAFPVCAAEPADGGPRVRLGGIFVSAGYTHWSGYPRPWFYPYWGGGAWPLYDAWWPGAFFHPGYWTGFAQRPNMGELKLRTQRKDAHVYIDGAYAGEVEKLKTIWLDPGAYNLELRTDAESFEKRIYVLSGKRLVIEPRFQPESSKEAKAP